MKRSPLDGDGQPGKEVDDELRSDTCGPSLADPEVPVQLGGLGMTMSPSSPRGGCWLI